MSFTNSTALNDYYESFTYGSSISFTLTFDGPAISSPNPGLLSGSTFGLSFFDATPVNILTNPSALAGTAGIVDILVDGTVVPTAFLNGIGPSVVTFSLESVPEPGTIALMCSGLFGLTLVRRRRSGFAN